MVCAGVLLLNGGASAQEGGKAIPKTTISLGTATPGGGFPSMAMHSPKPSMPPIRRCRVEPRNTRGSNENIPLLEAGQLDIATVAGEPSYEAFMGIGRPATRLKILTAMYSSPGMFVVRADSPYKTIRDLVGQPVAFGARGSGLPMLSRYMLDGLGLKQDEDFRSIYLERAGDGPAMVQDGRAAALWGAGIGWPGFTAMAESAGGAQFIAPGRRRDRAHPHQAHVSQAADDPRQQLSEADGGDRLGRLLEFHSRTRKPARRRRLSARPHAARDRG